MVEQSYEYLTDKLRISDTKLLPEKVQLAQYAIGVSEKNSVLRVRLNDAIRQLQVSGVYDQLVERWLGKNELSPAFVNTLVRNIAIGAAIGAIVVALVFYWVLKMLRSNRRELAAAYEQLAAENQQLLASYEEILNANKELEDMRAKEKSLLGLMGQLRPDVEDESFYSYLLELALSLVPEAQAGSILVRDDDGYVRFRAIRGYSSLLSTLDLRPEWVYRPQGVEVVRELRDSAMPQRLLQYLAVLDLRPL